MGQSDEVVHSTSDFLHRPRCRKNFLWIKTFSKKPNFLFILQIVAILRKWQISKQSKITYPTPDYFLCNFISSTKHENLQFFSFFLAPVLPFFHFLGNQAQQTYSQLLYHLTVSSLWSNTEHIADISRNVATFFCIISQLHNLFVISLRRPSCIRKDTHIVCECTYAFFYMYCTHKYMREQ